MTNALHLAIASLSKQTTSHRNHFNAKTANPKYAAHNNRDSNRPSSHVDSLRFGAGSATPFLGPMTHTGHHGNSLTPVVDMINNFNKPTGNTAPHAKLTEKPKTSFQVATHKEGHESSRHRTYEWRGHLHIRGERKPNEPYYFLLPNGRIYEVPAHTRGALSLPPGTRLIIDENHD